MTGTSFCIEMANVLNFCSLAHNNRKKLFYFPKKTCLPFDWVKWNDSNNIDSSLFILANLGLESAKWARVLKGRAGKMHQKCRPTDVAAAV
jgi:hypothetical protein